MGSGFFWGAQGQGRRASSAWSTLAMARRQHNWGATIPSVRFVMHLKMFGFVGVAHWAARFAAVAARFARFARFAAVAARFAPFACVMFLGSWVFF